MYIHIYSYDIDIYTDRRTYGFNEVVVFAIRFALKLAIKRHVFSFFSVSMIPNIYNYIYIHTHIVLHVWAAHMTYVTAAQVA